MKSLRTEASQLKEMLAEVMMENRLLKKACWGMARTIHELFVLGEAGDYRAG